MPSPVQKAINKIRGKHVDPLKVVDPVDIRLAEAKGQLRLDEMRQADIILIRDRNFEKAKQARAESLEQKRLEKERQEAIAEQRLKNLKKARKALERKRNAESE